MQFGARGGVSGSETVETRGAKAPSVVGKPFRRGAPHDGAGLRATSARRAQSIARTEKEKIVHERPRDPTHRLTDTVHSKVGVGTGCDGNVPRDGRISLERGPVHP